MEKINVYALRDVVADDVKTIFYMKTDGLAVRSILPVYAPKFPINDLRLYHIGFFDMDKMELKNCSPRIVSWDSYKFPQEQVSENKEVKDIEVVNE